MEFIKNSVMQSELPRLLNFKEDDIDWSRCHENALSSMVKKVCDLWSRDVKNVTKIITELKISRPTAIIYLKLGVELGWCDYDPKESIRQSNSSRVVKVICLTTGEIFDSFKEASKKYGIQSSSISACCRNNSKIKSAGKLEDGTKLNWMYYEDYIKTKLK